VHYKSRTVTIPAGIVTVRGTPSGDVRLEHRTEVRPGELPEVTSPSARPVVEAREDVEIARGVRAALAG
jgi:hypothetical protein